MKLDVEEMPKHVAVIMDGNRRWAKKRGLPVVAGHKRVVDKRVEELIDRAGELGVEYMTFWAFSTENWGRKKREVGRIMSLLRMALKKKAKRLIKKGARVKVIGDLSRFDKDIREGVEKLMMKSEKNNKITVTFALNYGGRDEILRAVNKLLEERFKVLGSRFKNKDINEEMLSSGLDTKDMPDPDLIIRTGGEKRLSGFMAWQSVYSELYFSKTLMPDFGARELDEAIKEYGRRNRRFGVDGK